jgi:uncharacterized membrane protein
MIMSPRYYLVTAILVLSLTAIVSVWKKKRSGKEILIVLGQVIAAVVLVVAVVAGLAKLLKELGIAESGLIL